ncbi:endonuclease domain-containing protein [Homoserinimonas sp. A520]
MDSLRDGHQKFVILMVQAGFTGLTSNFEITTRDGTEYRGDFAFPREKVIVEYQSEYHSETEQFRRDMTRIAKLQADGWYVMQVNADDLRNPRELTDRIRHVLSQRSVIA